MDSRLPFTITFLIDDSSELISSGLVNTSFVSMFIFCCKPDGNSIVTDSNNGDLVPYTCELTTFVSVSWLSLFKSAEMTQLIFYI